ncbi:hypothetical protein R9C00_01970 [Flammeovirgaceae bacterium SG7u.111]|nr:hypothetical protein [Flammeovirgaceae bacterium SG7u.132]WPO36209.1 hypothetical protein R9C00_01970 [Flammeovirgaceae bacterium SG7u.111]
MKIKKTKHLQMQRLFLYLLFTVLVLFSSPAIGGEIVIEGVYRGINLYVQNPHDGEGNYCISEIFVNDKKLTDVPQTTAFDIDLSFLRDNDPVKIKIIHTDNCKPKVINPNAIKAEKQFQFTYVDIDADVLKWAARGERTYGKYFILKFENNNWVPEKVVDCKGKDGIQSYEYNPRYHTGTNKYRVRYLEITGKVYFSNVIAFESDIEEVTFYPKRVSSRLNFSRPVKYAILDVYGKIVLQDIGQEVDCSKLKSGTYYVSYDNKTDKFFKK